MKSFFKWLLKDHPTPVDMIEPSRILEPTPLGIDPIVIKICEKINKGEYKSNDCYDYIDLKFGETKVSLMLSDIIACRVCIELDGISHLADKKSNDWLYKCIKTNSALPSFKREEVRMTELEKAKNNILNS